MTLYDIRGVDVFCTGTHKGDTYTERDLDQMVEAYSKVNFTPPLKDGHHDDTPGMPALGWVRNLRRVGSKLLADFADLPHVVYAAIRERKYDRISPEVYFHYKTQEGKVLPKVLKAVSLLGAEIPAIKELRPLREIVHTECGQVKRYQFFIKEGKSMRDAQVDAISECVEKLFSEDVSQEDVTVLKGKVRDLTDQLIRSYADRHGLEYREAMTRLFDERPLIKEAYSLS